jgi:hypothetical protein
MKAALTVAFLCLATQAQSSILSIGQTESFNDQQVIPPADFTFTITTENGTATWTVPNIGHFAGRQTFTATEANPQGADIQVWRSLLPASGFAQIDSNFGRLNFHRELDLQFLTTPFSFRFLSLSIDRFGYSTPGLSARFDVAMYGVDVPEPKTWLPFAVAALVLLCRHRK